MGSFSNLIDISSFFIGVLINLLLVALVCYYFKRKIDNLEVSQSEQAKMLYSLISRQEQQQQERVMMNASNTEQPTMSESNLNFLQNLDLNSLGTTHNSIVEIPNGEVTEEGDSGSDSDSDSDDDNDSCSDSESESNSVNEEMNETKVLSLNHETDVVEELPEPVEEIKSIQYNETEENVDYEKMTIKELKSLIESKGLQIKKNSKKQELIEVLVQQENSLLVEKTELTSDEEEIPGVVSEEEDALVESEPEVIVEDESELNVIEG